MPEHVSHALVHLAASHLRRLVREGLIVRAVAWPGLLCGGTLVATVVLVGVLAPAPRVAVEDVATRDVLVAAGIVAEVEPDPALAVASGRANRGVWSEAGQSIVAARRSSGPDMPRLESLIRDHVGASWRWTVLADPEPLSSRAEPFGRVLAALVAVLFILYGVVLGAAMVFRDRQEGILEAELALAIPPWVAAAVRTLAGGIILGSGLLATLLLFHALLGLPQWGAWLGHGLGAIGGALALGLATQTGVRGSESFSAGLSRGLVFAMGLAAAGFSGGGLLSALPIASVAGQIAGTSSPLLPLVGGFGAAALAIWRFGRVEGR